MVGIGTEEILVITPAGQARQDPARTAEIPIDDIGHRNLLIGDAIISGAIARAKCGIDHHRIGVQPNIIRLRLDNAAIKLIRVGRHQGRRR